jgi:spore maturation protein CgeB
MVRRLKADSVDFGLYGAGWPQGVADGENLYDFVTGAKLYRAAKLSLGISERADEDGYYSNRLLQAMAAGGAAHLCQRFAGMGACGLTDGDNLVVWDGVDDLVEKVRFWLRPENETQRKAIAERGERWACENHNFGVRVAELMDMLEMVI